MKLRRQDQIIVENLEVANHLWSRIKGLIGRGEFAVGSGMYIPACNSIHTFFMKFTIDCVFVDKNLKVKAVVNSVKPGRLVGPYWTSRSVFELPSGMIEEKKIQVGDQLHVGA